MQAWMLDKSQPPPDQPEVPQNVAEPSRSPDLVSQQVRQSVFSNISVGASRISMVRTTQNIENFLETERKKYSKLHESDDDAKTNSVAAWILNGTRNQDHGDILDLRGNPLKSNYVQDIADEGLNANLDGRAWVNIRHSQIDSCLEQSKEGFPHLRANHRSSSENVGDNKALSEEFEVVMHKESIDSLVHKETQKGYKELEKPEIDLSVVQVSTQVTTPNLLVQFTNWQMVDIHVDLDQLVDKGVDDMELVISDQKHEFLGVNSSCLHIDWGLGGFFDQESIVLHSRMLEEAIPKKKGIVVDALLSANQYFLSRQDLIKFEMEDRRQVVQLTGEIPQQFISWWLLIIKVFVSGGFFEGILQYDKRLLYCAQREVALILKFEVLERLPQYNFSADSKILSPNEKVIPIVTSFSPIICKAKLHRNYCNIGNAEEDGFIPLCKAVMNENEVVVFITSSMSFNQFHPLTDYSWDRAKKLSQQVRALNEALSLLKPQFIVDTAFGNHGEHGILEFFSQLVDIIKGPVHVESHGCHC